MPDPEKPERRSAADATGNGENGAGPKASGNDFMKRGYARAEERNQAAREALVPLEPGERPGPVTVGAIFSGVIALIFWASLIVSLFSDRLAGDSRPDPIQLGVFAAVMSAMAFGMWRVRYWAVLGFQLLLVLFLLAAVAGLVTAQTVLQAIATTILVLLVGFLFFRMIKAMARIQMPERPGNR